MFCGIEYQLKVKEVYDVCKLDFELVDKVV